jgi:hypothetical protein
MLRLKLVEKNKLGFLGRWKDVEKSTVKESSKIPVV